jgi:hypothetical protein
MDEGKRGGRETYDGEFSPGAGEGCTGGGDRCIDFLGSSNFKFYN